MAAKIRLSVAVGDYEIVRALKEGAVDADEAVEDGTAHTYRVQCI